MAALRPGIKNKPARSTCSSIAWPPLLPVTASHNAPDSRSSTEVSSKNARTCWLCRSSTSSVR